MSAMERVAISFSGGRSSAYMLCRLVEVHGGSLPDGWVVLFANTGREMPETLDFVRDVGAHLGVPIVWLEYEWTGCRSTFRVVDHATASRNGEPFEVLIRRKKFLPNVVRRYCTQELKINTMSRYLRAKGWRRWDWVIGLRADEPGRIAKMRAHNDTDRLRYRRAPMNEWGITKHDVTAFWKRMPFDLALKNCGGVTPEGNCDLCFLKGKGLLSSIARDRPERAVWWVDQEERTLASGKTRSGNARFIKDTPYSELPGLANDSLLPQFECIGCTD